MPAATSRFARAGTGAIAAALSLLLALWAPPAIGAHAARAGHPGLRHKLVLAARASHHADRAFVASARSFERCLAGHHGQSAPCAQRKRAVQSAGTKLGRAERHLARVVGKSNRHRRANRNGRAATDRRGAPAPTLNVEGQALRWSRVRSINTYVVMVRVPGQPLRYEVVEGTRYTPPAVPGVTVLYEVRTATYQSEWSTPVSIAYPATAPAQAPGSGSTEVPASEAEVANEPTSPAQPSDLAAPTLSLSSSGTSLAWSEVAGIGTYIVDTRTSSGDEYTAVHGTSFAPPAKPGTTVGYLVRTAVDGSAWSAEAKIKWVAEPPPKEEEKSAGKEAKGFQPGLDAEWDFAGAATLGARLVRVEFAINQPASALEQVIATYAAKGIRVQPLAGFYARIPSPAEAKNLAGWAKAYGPGGTYWSSYGGTPVPIESIEFGNETSYTYQFGDTQQSASYRERGERYGERLKEAAEAISAAGSSVGLLAQADDWTGNWVKAMFHAVPGFSKYVAGWTIHPYGPTWKKRIEDLIRQTSENGAPATIPVDITEWGLSTDNGRCLSENYGWNRCMSYTEAGEVLKRTVSEMRQAFSSRLQDFILYQVHDLSSSGVTTDREQYFGALQFGNQAKGAFTAAVESTLAS
jgi:hypothetical protein